MVGILLRRKRFSVAEWRTKLMYSGKGEEEKYVTGKCDHDIKLTLFKL